MAVVIVASLPLPWVNTRLGENEARVSGFELTATTWLVGLLLAVALASAVASILRYHWALRVVGIEAAAALLLGLTAVAVVAEILAVWITPDRVPDTLRRLALGVGPAVGMWIAIGAAALLLVGVWGSSKEVFAAASRVLRGVARMELAPWGGTCAIVGMAVFAFSRYGTWLDIESTVGDWTIPGWGLPWFGLAGLLLTAVAALLGIVSFRRPLLSAGFVLVTVGWLMSLAAAIVIVLAVLVGEFTAPEWLAERLSDLSARVERASAETPLAFVVPDVPDDVSVDVRLGAGSVMAYGSGALVGVGGLLVALAAAGEIADAKRR